MINLNPRSEGSLFLIIVILVFVKELFEWSSSELTVIESGL